MAASRNLFRTLLGTSVSESIERYLQALDTTDAQEGDRAEAKTARLSDKIAAMRARLGELRQLESQVLEAPDLQISLTYPDARAMATNMRGASVVGYNVQAAVDAAVPLGGGAWGAA